MSSSSSSSSSGDLFVNVIKEGIEVYDRLIEEINTAEGSRNQRRRRRHIVRNREDAHQRLVSDYFAEDAVFRGYYFRRRFHMRKELFFRICQDVTAHSDYIRQAPDASGTLGFYEIQKCTAALRILAYGTHPDAIDESFRMSARTARESLAAFCASVCDVYGPRYLRRPTQNDIHQLFAHHEKVHNLPGMIGSLDCMHWQWKQCPNYLKGQYSSGRYTYPSVVLEAVASQDLWVWHAFFGSPGSLNDTNILNMSPLFAPIYHGTDPDTSFQLRGTQYRLGYYLTDGIYHEYAVFVKSLKFPDDAQRLRFSQAQEKARKDVERTFGALKKRWQILDKASMFRDVEAMSAVMYTCIILHNMILEDEGNAICQYDPNEVIPDIQPFEVAGDEYVERMGWVDNQVIHTDLRRHLTDHLWSLNNLDLNVPPSDALGNQYSDVDPMG